MPRIKNSLLFSAALAMSSIAQARPDNPDIYPAMGYASDVNGMASLPGISAPARDKDISIYDGGFESLDGRVRFQAQQTGNKVWNIYSDGDGGVDHYGLYADLLGYDLAHFGEDETDAREALNVLFRSAEQYLRMWEAIGADGSPGGNGNAGGKGKGKGQGRGR